MSLNKGSSDRGDEDKAETGLRAMLLARRNGDPNWARVPPRAVASAVEWMTFKATGILEQRGIFGGELGAEDFAQRCAQKMWRTGAPGYDPLRRAKPYVGEMLTKDINSYGTKQGRRKTFASDEIIVADDRCNPSLGVAHAACREIVRAEIERLPARQQKAVVLRHLEGLDYSEIAAATGQRLKAAYGDSFRGRKTLRDRLDKTLFDM